MTTPALRDFLEIPYEKLEDMNLEVKSARLARSNPDKLREALQEVPTLVTSLLKPSADG